MIGAIKIVFLYIWGIIKYSASMASIYVPSPDLVKGTGSGWSKFWHSCSLSGKGLVGTPIGQYWHNGGGLGLNQVNAWKINTDVNSSQSAQWWADDIVRFYYGFQGYLPSARPATGLARKIPAAVGGFLYSFDNVLQIVYIKLFKIMNLQTTGQGTGINQWFKWCQEFGLSICVIVLLFYVIGVILAYNTSAFQRMKNAMCDIILITFIMGALPTFTNVATKGVTSIADGVLGNGYSRNSDVSTMQNQIFYDNVYDVPRAILLMKPGMKIRIGGTLPDGHQNKQILYQPNSYLYKGGYFSDSYMKPIKAKHVIINLSAMSPQYKNMWDGGLYDTSIPSFLQAYSSDEDVLNKATLDQIAKADEAEQSQISEKKTEHHVDHEGFWGMVRDDLRMQDPGMMTIQPNALAKSKKTAKKHIKPSTKGNNQNAVSQGIANKNSGISSKDMENLFEYTLDGTGNNASIQEVSSFGAFGSTVGQSVSQSYGQYYVNWTDIYFGLFVLAFVFLAFIAKLLSTFFKALVMYCTAGITLNDNAGNPNKLKFFIRSFINLYEMLAMDVITIRLYFVSYTTINAMINDVMFSGHGIVGNTMVIGILQGFCDIIMALCAVHGVDEVGQMLGAPTGAHGSWAKALMTMHLASGVGRAISSGVTAPARGALALSGLKGAGANLASRNAGKFAGSSTSSLGNASSNNKNGKGGLKNAKRLSNGFGLNNHHNASKSPLGNNENAEQKAGAKSQHNAFGNNNNNGANKKDNGSNNSKGISSAMNKSNKTNPKFSGNNNNANAGSHNNASGRASTNQATGISNTGNGVTTDSNDNSSDSSTDSSDNSGNGSTDSNDSVPSNDSSDTLDSSDNGDSSDSNAGVDLDKSATQSNNSDSGTNGNDSTPNLQNHNDADSSNPATQNNASGTKQHNGNGLGQARVNHGISNNKKPDFKGSQNGASNSQASNGINHHSSANTKSAHPNTKHSQNGSMPAHQQASHKNPSLNNHNNANRAQHSHTNNHSINGNVPHDSTPNFAKMGDNGGNTITPNNTDSGDSSDDASATGTDDSEPAPTENGSNNTGSIPTISDNGSNDDSGDVDMSNDSPVGTDNTDVGNGSPVDTDSGIEPNDSTTDTAVGDSTPDTSTGDSPVTDSIPDVESNDDSTGDIPTDINDIPDSPVDDSTDSTPTEDAPIANESTDNMPRTDNGTTANFVDNQVKPNTPHITHESPVDDPHRYDGVNKAREEASQIRANNEASTNSNPTADHDHNNNVPNFTDLAKHLNHHNDADNNGYHRHNRH